AQRCAHAPCLTFEHGYSLVILRAENGWSASLLDNPLFICNLVNSGTEKLGMIDRYGGDDRSKRLCYDICCIESAAKAGLQKHIIGRVLAEQLECCRGRNLEERYLLAAIPLNPGVQGAKQYFVCDEPAASHSPKPNTLMETHEMRRGVNMNALSRGFKNGPHESDRRTLAIGAGDMNY